MFLAVLHGAHAAFPVALVCGAFAVGHAVKGTRLAQPAAWTMAVALIWLKEKWYGALTFERVLGEGFAGLDQFRGLHPWRLSFNLAVLRIVSFNIDLHWAERQRARGRVAVAGASSSSAGHKDDQVRGVGVGIGIREGKDFWSIRPAHALTCVPGNASRCSCVGLDGCCAAGLAPALGVNGKCSFLGHSSGSTWDQRLNP